MTERAAFQTLCSYEALALAVDRPWLPTLTRIVLPRPWPVRAAITAGLGAWLTVHFRVHDWSWPRGRVLP